MTQVEESVLLKEINGLREQVMREAKGLESRLAALQTPLNMTLQLYRSTITNNSQLVQFYKESISTLDDLTKHQQDVLHRIKARKQQSILGKAQGMMDKVHGEMENVIDASFIGAMVKLKQQIDQLDQQIIHLTQ